MGFASAQGTDWEDGSRFGFEPGLKGWEDGSRFGFEPGLKGWEDGPRFGLKSGFFDYIWPQLRRGNCIRVRHILNK